MKTKLSIVAVAGIEPTTSCFMHLPLKGRALPTELHGIHFVYTPAFPSQTGRIAALIAGVIDK